MVGVVAVVGQCCYCGRRLRVLTFTGIESLDGASLPVGCCIYTKNSIESVEYAVASNP